MKNLTDELFLDWQQLLQPFEVDQGTVQTTFAAIATAYSSPQRYYHNLEHIQAVLSTINMLQEQAQDWQAIQFAV